MSDADQPTHCDVLVEHLDWLVTVDGERRLIQDGAVAIRNGRFVAVGTTEELRGWTADEVVSGARCVATPGFVDCHLHTSFQLSRGLADAANAQAFLFQKMYPYEAALTADDVYASAQLAALASARCGVTTLVDPGNLSPGSTVRAVREVGNRLVISRSAFDLHGSAMGRLPEKLVETTGEALEATEALVEEHKAGTDPLVTPSASFRGVNNSSDELITGLADIARRHDIPIQTHACFSYSTHDSSVNARGVPEVERLARLGVLDEHMVLLHGGWLEPQEFRLIVEHGASVIACPSSSVHNGYGNMQAGLHPELAEMGVPIGLGTDHACSGPTDIVQEMFLLSCGYKESRLNPRLVPPELALEMATIGGARAIGQQDRIGSVEVDKDADLVMFSTDSHEWLPTYDPVSNLVYSATGGTVRDVFVAGEAIVRDGRTTKVHQDDVYANVRTVSADLYARLDGRRLLESRWMPEVAP